MADLLEMGANFATILGIPILLISYIFGMASDRRRAESAVYDSLDDRYVEWQKIVAENPRLDIGDYPQDEPIKRLSRDEIERRRALYLILLAIFERSFILYANASRSARRRQWEGWLSYIDSYCQRAAFIDAFYGGQSKVGYFGTFDRNFESFIVERIELATSAR